MLSFDVTIKDTATPRLASIERAYARGAHRKIMAHSGANVVKQHFTRLDAERHRGHGGRHFYAAAARATHDHVRGGKAVVSIDHEGIALRRFGARNMKPRVATYFTIPVDDAAQGKRVREFGDGVQWIINRRKGKGVVLLKGRVLYALTKTVTHKPDPSVLPTDKEVADQVTDDLRVWTDLQGDRANG